jgi:membrane fusion protein (multidrug efflux system)
VTAAELGIKSLQAQLQGARASLQQAQAQLDQAKLNLQYTDVLAFQSGRVVKLSGAKGSFVTPGQSLMMFVPDEIWITANYKETQLADMRAGQTVDVRIDAYPGRTLNGRVESVQPGSGTAFSLLPAENATGNYVKVVQRVPVKIVIDNWPSDLPVGPGMSVVPWTRVR